MMTLFRFVVQRHVTGLTTAMWTVNSTPIPTLTIRMTAGTALRRMSDRPINPNSSTTIIVSTTTYRT